MYTKNLTYLKCYIVILTLKSLILTVDAFFGYERSQMLDIPPGVSLMSTSTKWFTQKLDHFSHSDTRTWQQRYHMNDAYYNESTKNNIFFMIGAESAASPGWVSYGAWMDTVNQYGGLLLHLEHRFYGESQPLGDLSTENLKYLSSHQALEDAANFIQSINTKYNLTESEVKWIVFGGSYGGTLAAWLRKKYPHLVAGAMSSSAPLKAVLDFPEYYQMVANGLATHSQACVTNVKSAFSQLEVLVSSCLEDEEVYTELNEKFKLCHSIENSEENDKDLSYLFASVASNIAYVVQYHGVPGVGVSINTVCDIMVNETSDDTDLYKLAKVTDAITTYLGGTCTYFKYDEYIPIRQNITANPNSMMRQWLYQTCTEFGFYQTSSQEIPVFGSRFDINFYTGMCQDIFGTEFNETLINLGIRATNNRYAATRIKTSNIVYFHGGIDPWSVLGKLESSDDGHSVIIVDGASHCVNMYADHSSDPPALTAARIEINSLIGQWLGLKDPNDNNNDNGNSCQRVKSSIVLLGVFLIGFSCFRF